MFNNIKKRKALIDREISVYKEEQLLTVNRNIYEYSKEANRQLETLGLACSKQIGEYEHDFHSTKERLGIELAKLESKRDAIAEIVDNDRSTYKAILAEKDAEIKRLNDIVLAMVKAQPAITIQQLKH